jgi:SSS family solute:Na+ symporter
MPEGAAQVLSIASENNKFSLGSFGLSLKESTFWVVFAYGIFINLQNFSVDQNYIQRYMSSRSLAEAQKSAFWGGMLYVPVSLIFLFIGTALFAYYNSGAGILPEELQDITRSDRVFPYFIANELPPGLKGLLVSSIFAAGMSTISTSYNSSATIFLTDFYEKYSKRQHSDRSKMMALYMASAVIGVLGMLIGIAMINVKSTLDTWWKLASIFSGGILGLFLLGAFTKAKNVMGAIVGVLVGLVIIIWLSLSNIFLGPDAIGNQFHTYLTIVFGTSAIFIVGFLIGLLTKDNKK